MYFVSCCIIIMSRETVAKPHTYFSESLWRSSTTAR